MRIVHSIEEVEAAGGYQIILADPPWEYRQKGRGAAANHYSTQKTNWVEELSVVRIASKNAVLFVWGTWPNLFEAKKVIEAWGFQYKTLGFLWVKCEKSGKTFWGGGSYARANSEFCLMATRGKMSAISHSVHQLVETWEEREDVVLRAPIGEHSQKPSAIRDRIVELFGDLPRIELFARERVSGWDAFGNDPALGGPDVDLSRNGEQEETKTTQFDENTYFYTYACTEAQQGEINMGQMPQSVRERIAKSQATSGGNNIRHGEYILMYWKSSYDKMNSGYCHINEFVVVSAKKIAVMEGDKPKDIEPNEPGTMCGYVINYDGKGKQSADGNSKALVLGLFGLNEGEVSQEDVGEALADLTADNQPAKGMLIKCTTYPKEVRSRPGNYITGLKWECVNKPGEGENAVEKAAARIAEHAATLTKKAAA